MWRPFNFIVPVMREYTYTGSIALIKAMAEKTANMVLFEDALNFRTDNGTNWYLSYTKDSISTIKKVLKLPEYKIVVLMINFMIEDDLIGMLPAIVFKDSKKVELYYGDSKFFETPIASILADDFIKLFDSIQSNYQYTYNENKKYPKQILMGILRTYKELYQDLVLCPEFESFDFLWYLYSLTERLRLRADTINPSREDVPKIYKDFVSFVYDFSDFLWSILPEECRKFIVQIQEEDLGEREMPRDENAGFSKLKTTPVIRKDVKESDELERLIRDCTSSEKKKVKDFYYTQKPTPSDFKLFMEENITNVTEEDLENFIKTVYDYKLNKVWSRIEHTLHRLNVRDSDKERTPFRSEELAVSIIILTIYQIILFSTPTSECGSCLPNKSESDLLTRQRITEEGDKVFKKYMKQIQNNRYK